MDTKKHTILSISKACQYVGGQARLAHLLHISPSAVGHWVLGRRPIPAERCPAIEKATSGAVRCEELRPDVDWSYLRSTVTTQKPHIPGPSPIPEAETSPECPIKGKMLIIDTSDRRDEERRNGERRKGDRRRNSNGGGLRVGERRVCDRRGCDRRE